MMTFAACGELSGAEALPIRITSPDGRIVTKFWLDGDGAPRYSIEFDGKTALAMSQLGLVREDTDFSHGLRFDSASDPEPVDDQYEILTAKRRVNRYRANRQVFHLQDAESQKLDIVFQVSDDGVAYRYVFPESSNETRRLTEECSSFHFARGTKAWLQPMSVAKTGWSRVNPCYEEYYEKEIPVGTPSPTGAGWVYPALFHSGKTWLLVSECGLGRNYCGTRLRHESPDGEYRVGFPDPREHFQGGPVNPESTLPWITPWRIVSIGDLATIAESTLGIDLVDSPTETVDVSDLPGKASWSWPLLGDGQTVYDVQKQFIDYAADMHWKYCLIDSMWDQQIGFEKLQELVDYAHEKDVKILVWYNSNGDWNDAPQTPRHKLLTHESRIEQFDQLKSIGVAGLKIDFFGGDGQSQIDYYLDILEDAAPYGFTINFHGATLPRGWQRTYPHFMTAEAVKGLEFVTFEQRNADEEPAHCTVLPFTRNVFDPMDFTPMVLDRIRRIERRTTSGFELALSVLFTSGIQHYAEIPAGMAKTPEYVQDFLRGVPSVWDDIQFLDGYPGKFVVIARKGEGRWYLAGINGESRPRDLSLDLGRLAAGGAATTIVDGNGGNLSFRQETVELNPNVPFELTLPPHGGFVAALGGSAN